METQLEEQLRRMNIIHLALVAGAVLFAVVVYVLSSQIEAPQPELGGIMELVVPLLAIFIISFGHLTFKKRLKYIKENGTVEEKLEAYVRINITRWASLEAAAFLGVIGYMLTQHNNLILYASMIIVLLLYTRPLRSRVVEDLGLSEE